MLPVSKYNMESEITLKNTKIKCMSVAKNNPLNYTCMTKNDKDEEKNYKDIK